MDIMMKDFIDYIFGSEILQGTHQGTDEEITDVERQQIINSMMMIVFSHRYSKGDKFILESRLAPAPSRRLRSTSQSSETQCTSTVRRPKTGISPSPLNPSCLPHSPYLMKA